VLAAEAVVLAAVVAGALRWGNRVPLHPLSPEAADALALHGEPAARDARFGDRFVLRGAAVRRGPGGLEVQLAWRSCRHQRLDKHVLVQVLDATGNLLSQEAHPQHFAGGKVRGGAQWLETARVPGPLPPGAAWLAVALWDPAAGT